MNMTIRMKPSSLLLNALILILNLVLGCGGQPTGTLESGDLPGGFANDPNNSIHGANSPDFSPKIATTVSAGLISRVYDTTGGSGEGYDYNITMKAIVDNVSQEMIVNPEMLAVQATLYDWITGDVVFDGSLERISATEFERAL